MGGYQEIPIHDPRVDQQEVFRETYIRRLCGLEPITKDGENLYCECVKENGVYRGNVRKSVNIQQCFEVWLDSNAIPPLIERDGDTQVITWNITLNISEEFSSIRNLTFRGNSGLYSEDVQFDEETVNCTLVHEDKVYLSMSTLSDKTKLKKYAGYYNGKTYYNRWIVLEDLNCVQCDEVIFLGQPGLYTIIKGVDADVRIKSVYGGSFNPKTGMGYGGLTVMKNDGSIWYTSNSSASFDTLVKMDETWSPNSF